MITFHQSIEVEQRVLETLMHFGVATESRVQKAILKLSTDCFFTHDNAMLFTMIRDCFNSSQPFSFVDILMLVPKNNQQLHDTMTWIIDNYGKFHVSEINFESDVDKLILMTTLRKQALLMETALQRMRKCPQPDQAEQILIESITDISNLAYRESKDGITNHEIADAFYSGALADDLIIQTTCTALNNALNGGIMSKSLVTVAAAAGVGKTGFAIYLMDAIARIQPGTQSLFFSLEMEAKHIWTRHVGICGGNLFEQLNQQEKLNAVAKSLEIPVKIYDTASCKSASDIDYILTTARLKAIEKPISVIVVDYLGLVDNHGDFDGNHLRHADTTSKLAKLAMELNCVVIALSQINRQASARATDDRCPYPSDAADSSGSHRSSTLWLGIDRPELYRDDPQYRNQFVIKCRKNRFGGNFELTFAFNDGTFSEFYRKPFGAPKVQPKSAEKAIFSYDA